MDLAQILSWLVIGLRFAAERTETTIDDRFVEFIEVVKDSPELIAWVQSLLDAAFDDNLRAAPVPEGVKAALAGFDWQTVIGTLLPLLLEILRRR